MENDEKFYDGLNNDSGSEPPNIINWRRRELEIRNGKVFVPVEIYANAMSPDGITILVPLDPVMLRNFLTKHAAELFEDT